MLEGKTASDITLHLVRRVVEHFLPFSRVEGGGQYEHSALPNMGDAANERAIMCGGKLNRPQISQSLTDIHTRMQSSKTDPPPHLPSEGEMGGTGEKMGCAPHPWRERCRVPYPWRERWAVCRVPLEGNVPCPYTVEVTQPKMARGWICNTCNGTRTARVMATEGGLS